MKIKKAESTTIYTFNNNIHLLEENKNKGRKQNTPLPSISSISPMSHNPIPRQYNLKPEKWRHKIQQWLLLTTN